MRYNLLAASALAASIGVLAAQGARAQDADLVAEGERAFRKCAACHMVGPNATNRVGPQLNGVIDRAAGTLPDFTYSDAMVEFGAAGNVWDDATLDAYLENPRTTVKGTKMAFAGLKKEEERAAVIAYIKSAAQTGS